MRQGWARILGAGLLVLLVAPGLLGEDDANLMVPSSCPLPDRCYDWNLPAQPNRPWEPMPHFEQSPILPYRIEFNAIPKANLMPENLRPRDLENQALTLNTLEREDIMPPHLLDAPLAPPHMAPIEDKPHTTPYTGSMIFLSELPEPQEIPRERPQFEGEEPIPDHRQLLGW